jgi:hypothetical protein
MIGRSRQAGSPRGPRQRQRIVERQRILSAADPGQVG